MIRPRRIPSQAGFELRIFRSRGGRLNHLANEAVPPIRLHHRKRGSIPGSAPSQGKHLTTWPQRRSNNVRFLENVMLIMSKIVKRGRGGGGGGGGGVERERVVIIRKYGRISGQLLNLRCTLLVQKYQHR